VEIVVTLSQEFWRDRRVFLTGHAGFKGAWASLMLHALCSKQIEKNLNLAAMSK